MDVNSDRRQKPIVCPTRTNLTVGLTPTTLLEAAKRDWLEEASRLVYPDSHDLPAWRAFVDTAVRLARRHMPPGIAEFFSADGPDTVLLENLPIDAHLPPPPSDGKRPASKSAVSESVIAGIIESHAAIVCYSNEKAGVPIHGITPVVGLEHVPSSAGRAPFVCHTDAAFLAPCFCPRDLLLFGLRNQTDAPTAVLPLDRILEAASPALARSLDKPIFRHPAPSSFEMKAAVIAPIVWYDARGPLGSRSRPTPCSRRTGPEPRRRGMPSPSCGRCSIRIETERVGGRPAVQERSRSARPRRFHRRALASASLLYGLHPGLPRAYGSCRTRVRLRCGETPKRISKNACAARFHQS
jgi:hypothetical protein